MQYIVHSTGDVLIQDKREKSYVIDAESESDAKKIARIKFSEEFSVSTEYISTKEFERSKIAIAALVIMSVSIMFSFIGWMHGHERISISPNLTSCIYAIVIYCAFVIRVKGISRSVSSWIDIAFCVVVPLLLASFIRIVLANETLSVFGLFEIPIKTDILLPVIAVISILGLKLVSAICVVGIALMAICNISALSEAMNISGIIYLFSAFIGFLLYLYIEPAFYESMACFKISLSEGTRYIKNDFIEAKQSAQKLGSTIHKVKSKQINSTDTESTTE